MIRAGIRCIAYGTHGGSRALWASADRRSWERQPSAESAFTGGRIDDLDRFGDVSVAVGTADHLAGGDRTRSRPRPREAAESAQRTYISVPWPPCGSSGPSIINEGRPFSLDSIIVADGGSDNSLFLNPWLRWVMGPACTTAAALASPLALKAPLLAVGLGVVAAGNVTSDRRSKALNALRAAEDAQFNLTKLLQHIVTMTEAAFGTSQARSLRANVMLPDPTVDDKLRIAYYTGGYHQDELGLAWGRGQGVVGEAWDTGEALASTKG